MGSNLFTSALSGMNAAQIGLATTEHKLDTLLRSFRFGRLCDVIEQIRP